MTVVYVVVAVVSGAVLIILCGLSKRYNNNQSNLAKCRANYKIAFEDAALVARLCEEGDEKSWTELCQLLAEQGLDPWLQNLKGITKDIEAQDLFLYARGVLLTSLEWATDDLCEAEGHIPAAAR